MKVVFLIILFFASNAWALPDEVCSDGLDNDGAGGDVLCATNTFPSGCIDQDRDGYCSNSSTGPNTGIDCDDTLRNVFPNPAVGVATGCAANEAKTCLSTGLYSACSSGGWKPTDCTTAYYFSPSGTDGGTCTFASPCKTPNMFSDRTTGSPPANFITAAAGMCFIFRTGTYDGATGVVTNSGSKYWLVMTSKTGTANSPIRILGYPGETATITLTPTDTTPLIIYGSSYVKVGPNLRFTANHCLAGGLQGDAGCVSAVGAYTGAVSSSDHIEFYGFTSDNNTGLTGDNLGGIYIHSNTNFSGHHLAAYKNIGTGGGDTRNNVNILTFRNSNFSLTDSVMSFDSAAGYSNFRNKHSNADSSIVFSRNIFLNGSVYFSSPSVIGYNNYGEAGQFFFGDTGGPAFFGSFDLEKNTIRKGPLLYFDFTKGYANNDGSTPAADVCSGLPVTPTNFTLSNNIDYKTTVDAQESREWEISTYKPESTLKTSLDSIFTPSSNLYYNSASAVSFAYFEANNGTSTCVDGAAYGTTGASYSLASVKSSLSKETNSYEEDPLFVTNSWIAASTNSTAKGWNVNWGTAATSSLVLPSVFPR